MKKTKYMIGVMLCIMVIGIAAVTTNVIVNMSTPITSNPDDFLVYFSNVKVNGVQDLTLVRNEKTLMFDGEFSALGDKKVISYDVTNASKDYDAMITLNCTESTNYLTITNSFDTSTSLAATSSRTGTLTIELTTAASEETSQGVTCTISANAVERTAKANDSVADPLDKTTISFTIHGASYTAYRWMTWGEWVESDFNSGQYYMNYGGSITDRATYPVTDNNGSVSADDYIVPDGEYFNYS